MIIRMKNYPLSSKLTALNGLLLIADIFACFVVFLIIFTIFGGLYAERTDIQNGIMIVTPIICFFVFQVFINKITDKKYTVILEEYNKKLAKLTPENPEEVKDKILTQPVKVKFTRVKCNEGKLQKQTFYINDTEYVLKNGESVEFTTNKALNMIEIKQFGAKDTKYFTVSDGEQIEITYAKYKFDDIERKTTF